MVNVQPKQNPALVPLIALLALFGLGGCPTPPQERATLLKPAWAPRRADAGVVLEPNWPLGALP